MKNDPHDAGTASPYRIAYLVAGYIRNTLQDKERDELDEWITASDNNLQLFAELTDDDNIRETLNKINGIDKRAEWKKLLYRIKPIKQHGNRVRRLWLYTAAASVVITAGLFIFFKPNNRESRQAPTVAIVPATDLPPGGNRATLTLDDGSNFNLDKTTRNFVAGNIMLENDISAGKLVYQNSDINPGVVTYHTLSTPRGGQYKVILPDGSKAWLNAATTLRYPSVFTGKQRVVELTGEAYFEITKNNGQPFVVNLAGNNKIEVTGTQFNTKAYTEETAQVITLIEGSVRITDKNNDLELKAGQQAMLASEGLQLNRTPDIQEVIAWKNNQFKFTDATIEEIMTQVQRWYDTEIVYRQKITDHFNATISRNVPVSKLLRYLELTKQIHFKIEAGKIIVMK